MWQKKITFILPFGLLTKSCLLKKIDLFSSFISFLLKPSNMKDVLVEMPLKIKQKKLEKAESRQTQENLWIRWWVSYDIFIFF